MEIEKEKLFRLVCSFGISYDVAIDKDVMKVLRGSTRFKKLATGKAQKIPDTSEMVRVITAGPKRMIAVETYTEGSERVPETDQLSFGFTREDIETLWETGPDVISYMEVLLDYLREKLTEGISGLVADKLELGWRLHVEHTC